MTWEKRRKAGVAFYYRSKRSGSRVVKEYLGSLTDPVVAVLARQDRLSTAERRADRESVAEERRVYDAIDARLGVLHEQLRRALDVWMHGPVDKSMAKYNRTVVRKGFRTLVGNQRRQPVTRDEFDELVKRAEMGDADALSKLRKLIRADPSTWRRFGDLTEHVKLAFLGLMVHNNIVARESLSLELDELTRELRQGHQSPMRKLVIDQILILWLDVHYQQTMAAPSREGKTDIEFIDRRLAKTRKRYFAALETLGRMDRILGLTPVKMSNG